MKAAGDPIFSTGFTLCCLACCLLLGRPPVCSGRTGSEPTRMGPSGPPLVFDSELVRLTVTDDSLRVEGLYRFSCRPGAGDVALLFYPFPTDSLLGEARMDSLFGRQPDDEWCPLRFDAGPPTLAGVRWLIPLDECDRYDIRAHYSQALLGNYGCYIVTTIGGWQYGLVEARFEIVLPEDATPTSFSFPFEPRESGGETIYVFEPLDFRPDRDIEFTWSR